MLIIKSGYSDHLVDPGQLLVYLTSNRDRLKKDYHVIRIGIFGSIARGDHKESSDIDLLVENDTKSFDASMMNFIIIGEMIDKLSENLLNVTSDKIDWLNVKGFRNIIAHNYFGIDAQEVRQIINSSLIELKENLETIIR